MKRKETKLSGLRERLKQERNIERLQKEYAKAVEKYDEAEKKADRLYYELNNALTNK